MGLSATQDLQGSSSYICSVTQLFMVETPYFQTCVQNFCSLHCDALLQCNSHQYQIQSIQLKQLLQQTNKCSNHHIRYPCPPTSSLHAEKRGNLAITYAEIGLALRTMVFGFPPQDPPTSVCCVPAEVARKGRPLSCLREKLIGETSRHLLTLGQCPNCSIAGGAGAVAKCLGLTIGAS